MRDERGRIVIKRDAVKLGVDKDGWLLLAPGKVSCDTSAEEMFRRQNLGR